MHVEQLLAQVTWKTHITAVFREPEQQFDFLFF